MTEPRTAAGRALLEYFDPLRHSPDLWDRVGEVEAEAASPDSEALRAALERIEFRAQGQSLSGLRVRPEAALTAIREEARAALTPEAKDE
jgi:hypothetical protein